MSIVDVTRKAGLASAVAKRGRKFLKDHSNGAEWARRKVFPTRPKPKQCECCGKEKELHLDHDHESGKFRGWLCTNCNTALGKLGDNIEGLLRAIHYLAGK